MFNHQLQIEMFCHLSVCLSDDDDYSSLPAVSPVLIQDIDSIYHCEETNTNKTCYHPGVKHQDVEK